MHLLFLEYIPTSVTFSYNVYAMDGCLETIENRPILSSEQMGPKS